MVRHSHLAAILLGLLLASSALGCRPAVPQTPQTPPAEQTATTPPPAETTETASVRLYFVRAEKIGVAGREVTTTRAGEPPYEAAISALLEGPTAEETGYGLSSAIPAGVGLGGVEVTGGVATVDVGSGFETGGGSLSMQLRIAQVVYTLTQFREVERVAFEIDGRPVESIGGEGVIVSPAVSRADFESVTPAILVETPVPGESVSSPIMLTGSANVFEAQFQAVVEDAEKTVLTEQFVQAESGTGTRGAFSTSIEFAADEPGLGTLIVSEPSAQDGSPTNVVEIPVRLQ